MVPQQFAGLSVETSNSFLQIRAVTEITHDVKFAIGDDRRGLTWEIGNPKRLLDINVIRKVFFEGYSGLLRPTPTEPSMRRCGANLQAKHQSDHTRARVYKRFCIHLNLVGSSNNKGANRFRTDAIFNTWFAIATRYYLHVLFPH